jgi:hypothetical protein
MAVVIVVVLHGLLLWQQKIDYLIFLPSGKEKSPSIRAKTTAIAYSALTPIYLGLTALNIPARWPEPSERRNDGVIFSRQNTPRS